MARRRGSCPGCSQSVGRHAHTLTPGRVVYLCDYCDEFAPYVVAALVDDLHAEAELGVAAEWLAVTADDHDSAAWSAAA